MSATPVFTGIDLSPLLDVPFSGLLISIALYGVIMVQAWSYFNENQDKWPLRLLVSSMVVLDLAASVLEIIPYREILIAHFGDVSVVQSETSIKHTLGVVMTSAVIAFIVQIFFASRVYVLNRLHPVVPAFIVLCATGTLICGLLISIEGFRHPTWDLLMDSKTKLQLGLSCGLAALCDLSATLALMWSFRISKTGFKRTDTMLSKLLQFTVTRGILITAVQVTLFALYVADDPAKLQWTAPVFCGSKVYVITMLTILNNRSSIRNDSSAILVNSVTIRNTQNIMVIEQDSRQPTDDIEGGYMLHSLNSTGIEREVDESHPKPPISDSKGWWAAASPTMPCVEANVDGPE